MPLTFFIEHSAVVKALLCDEACVEIDLQLNLKEALKVLEDHPDIWEYLSNWNWPSTSKTEEFHRFISQDVHWRYVQLLLCLLHFLEMYTDSSLVMYSDFQGKCVGACLQLVVALGISLYLQPGVGLPSSTNLATKYNHMVSHHTIQFSQAIYFEMHQ